MVAGFLCRGCSASQQGHGVFAGLRVADAFAQGPQRTFQVAGRGRGVEESVRIVPAMNMDKWIALVRERIEELDISQEQLAERVGVSQGSIGHWLKKRRQPRVDSMNRTFIELGMPHYQVSMQLRVLGQVGEILRVFPLSAA
ncbi:hypothetical protein WR25_18527 [Diploscapter pachys]|uniref:HTH cro/C1-type domain-containing protein n=1 Tax=Diploscapter pachys TaxID=2018661 RepID=A0A2A2M4J4_9BILA|nr:hypothetical protein WR25_18527 [Diploscapter pachys]